MIVCVCRRISDREITDCAQQGMGFDEVQFELGVATQCGRCADCAKSVIGQCHSSHEHAAASSMAALAAPTP
ncbi:(2Fe-2S)-binding protein [Saezia sanguinis]|uniref:(2Fe-2S)-binding protein n=1 Tax=Saezia sanguinis TaxID=1965230 RepID=UPI00305A7C77